MQPHANGQFDLRKFGANGAPYYPLPPFPPLAFLTISLLYPKTSQRNPAYNQGKVFLQLVSIRS